MSFMKKSLNNYFKRKSLEKLGSNMDDSADLLAGEVSTVGDSTMANIEAELLEEVSIF